MWLTLQKYHGKMMAHSRLTRRSYAKMYLVILNGLCALLSIGTMFLVLVDVHFLKHYINRDGNGILYGSIFTVICCQFMLFAIVFGTLGAIRENVRVLYLYIGMLTMLVIYEIFITVYVLAHRSDLQLKVSDWIRNDFFRNVTADDWEEHTKLWDELQIVHQCCGPNGPSDYKAVQRPITLSCCSGRCSSITERAQQEFYTKCIEYGSYYTRGCEDEILFFVRADAIGLIAVACTCFLLETAGIILALYMTVNIKESYNLYKLSLKH